MIKLVAISDTHGLHSEIKVPAGDILVVAGDFTLRGAIEEVADFNKWLGDLPHKFKVVVPGNHDLICQNNHSMVKGMLTNAVYLDCEQAELMGLKFYGCPWTPEFFDWAYMYRRGSNKADMIWASVPEDTNVLVTHGPPAGLSIGVVTNAAGDPKEDAGCWAQRSRIAELPNLKAAICGHIHCGYGMDYIKGVPCYNVSILDDRYMPEREATVICL